MPNPYGIVLNTGEKVAIAFILIIILTGIALGIAAFALVMENRNHSHTPAHMARTTVAAQSVSTGGAIVLFDTPIGVSNGFTYADGKFTAENAGFYAFIGNLAINVSGTGGGGTTIGPISAWVSKDNSTIQYGLNNSEPLETSFVSGNSQYVTWSTIVQMDAGESLWLNLLAPTEQQILGGVSCYVAIGVPEVTC